MSAPLRITRNAAIPEAARALDATETPDPVKDYIGRLVKLIPGEVVSIYLVGTGIIPAGQSFGLAIWAAVCLGLVVVVRAYSTSDPAKHLGPQWPAVIIAAISFVIWVYTIGGPFTAYGLAVPWAGSLAVLVWTFLIPYIYKGNDA
jgi:hypothetical protein